MKPKWQIRDLIDLEYFLQEDDDADDEVTVRRDRDIYLKEILPLLEKDGPVDETDRKSIIRLWIESRRRLMKTSPGRETILPGKLFADIFTLLLVFLLVAGLGTGIVLAFAFLQYRGTEPVNVFAYFGVFVLLQIILLCFLVSFSLLRRWVRSLRHISLIQSVLGLLLTRIFRKIAVHTTSKLSGENRNRLAAVIGIMKGQKQVYGHVFAWPIFMLAQIFGIGFNLGVLAGSILRITTQDLAFGWQSTIQFSSQAVYMFVKTTALPWSWLLSPAISHPTYAQIEGSRMVLKDGIYDLATQDLVSWWPFLLLAVLCYGFLPRIILFGVGIIARKRALGSVALNHAACNRLLRRLNTPVLETDGTMTANDGSGRPDDSHTDVVQPKIVDKALQGHDAIVIVPDDIFGQFPNEALEGVLKERLGINCRHQIQTAGDVEEDKKALTDLAVSKIDNERYSVVVLQEAWQPPIAETFFYLQKLRKLLGSNTQIYIFLIGKPIPEAFFANAEASDWHIWKQMVQKLGDPFLEINGLRNF